MHLWRVALALLLSGCSAYDYGLAPIHFGAGEASRPQLGYESTSKVKSRLMGSPSG